METLLSIVRAVILIGAVLFSFGLLLFGFHVVVREYRMLRTRKQIEEFLRITNEAGLQADAAKGTRALSLCDFLLELLGRPIRLNLGCSNIMRSQSGTSRVNSRSWKVLGVLVRGALVSNFQVIRDQRKFFIDSSNRAFDFMTEPTGH